MTITSTKCNFSFDLFFLVLLINLTLTLLDIFLSKYDIINFEPVLQKPFQTSNIRSNMHY